MAQSLLTKEEIETNLAKYTSEAGNWGHLIPLTPELKELMIKHGKKCKYCAKVFLPGSIWREYYLGMTHYPTEEMCGFCVYEDSMFHSYELWHDEHGRI